DQESAVALHAETEGNPLFTVEMVRAGFPQQKASLPDKVRSVIEIRLGKLTSQAQEVAGLAAVIGRSFDFSTLVAASPQPDEEVLASLDELWQQQIVREQGEHDYDFSHDKIRQVALLRLSLARRRWWHGRVARALEQTSVTELETVRGQIAAHWEAAGYSQKAVTHYMEAARVASQLYAHEEVTGYLQRALALLPENDTRRTDIYAQMGEALLALGQFEEAAANFQAAANRTEDVVKSVNLFAWYVRSLSGSRQFEEAKNVYRKALSLLETALIAEPEGRIWRIWIDLHLSLLNVLYFANEPDEMEKVCDAMATSVEAHGTARQRAQYLAAVSRMRCRILRYKLTDEDVTERRSALQWARETDDDSLIAGHHFSFGFILLWAGYPETASNELYQAAAQAEALGNVPLQSRCLTYLAIAYRMLDNETGVRQTVEKMVPVARAEGNHIYLGVAEALRAWLMWKARDIETAEEHGRAALRQWEAVKSPPYPMEWLARLPLLAIALERADSNPHLSDVREQARAMLVSPQQRLPDALTAALERVVVADTPSATVINLQEACHLAQEHGYL
ncbi:MAG: ATP-binding protein, partial [Chloroflexota bacterium]